MAGKKYFRRLSLLTLICGVFYGVGSLMVLLNYQSPEQFEYIYNHFFLIGGGLLPFGFLGIYQSLGNEERGIHFLALFLSIFGHCMFLSGLYYPAGPVLLIFGILLFLLINQREKQIQWWIMWLLFLGFVVSFALESVAYPIFRHGFGALIVAVALIFLGKNLRR